MKEIGEKYQKFPENMNAAESEWLRRIIVNADLRFPYPILPEKYVIVAQKCDFVFVQRNEMHNLGNLFTICTLIFHGGSYIIIL